MENLRENIPEAMVELLNEAAQATKKAKRVMAFSHIDADGISALAVIIRALEFEEKEFQWRNIHQINSESIIDIKSSVEEFKPDLVIFSDFGTGQFNLVKNHIASIHDVEQDLARVRSNHNEVISNSSTMSSGHGRTCFECLISKHNLKIVSQAFCCHILCLIKLGF